MSSGIPQENQTLAPPGDRFETLSIVVVLAIVALALVQAIVPSSPDVYWDTDPRSQLAERGRLIITSITPTMLAFMQMMMLALATLGLVLHLRGRQARFHPLICVLALFGMAAAAFHVMRGGPHVQPGAQWLTACAGALAVFHLVQADAVRRWVLASLIAMLVPLAFKAGWYTFVEHAETVKMFMANKEQFMRERGWAPDSPNALIFVRRMLDPEAAGAYGLSNVFGSIVASLTAMAAAVAAGLAARAKGSGSSSRWAAVICMSLATVAGIFAVYLSRSKGAFAAMLVAFGVTVIGAMLYAKSKPGAPPSRRWGVAVGLAGILMIAGANLAVVARGHLGPPPNSTGGERSIFFRSQYFDAAYRYVTTSPREVVARGVGPAGFQAVYQQIKDPLNPEEVMSTHNVIIDFVVMLGAGGVAWSLLMLGWIWQAGRGAGQSLTLRIIEADESGKPTAVARRELLGAALLTAAIFFTQHRIQIDMVTASNAVVWLVCMGCYVLATLILASKTGWLAKIGLPWVAMAGFAGAVVLMVHGQIEMTFFNTGGSVLAWMILAASAGVGVAAQKISTESAEAESPTTPPTRMRHLAMGLVIVVGLAATVTFAIGPMRRTLNVQSNLAEASAKIRANDYAGAIESLNLAKTIDPRDADIWRSWASLNYELADGLRGRGRIQEANAIIQQVTREVERAAAVDGVLPNEGKLLRGLGDVYEMVETDVPRAERLEQALTIRARMAIELNPYSIEERMRFARTLDLLGHAAEAIEAYQYTLELNRKAYLDPAKQLPDRDRLAIEERIRTLESSVSKSSK